VAKIVVVEILRKRMIEDVYDLKGVFTMDNKNGKKNKLVISTLVVFIIFGLCGGGYWWYYNSKYVTTEDARIDGSIVSISSKVNGKIAKLMVAQGDSVKSGQVIAYIDPQDIAAQKAQAQASLAVAQANFDQVQNGLRPQEMQQAKAGADQALANLNNASKNNDRMQELFLKGAVSVAQRDNAFAVYQVAKEAYTSAREGFNMALSGSREEAVRAAAAQVKQAEAALKIIELTQNDTTIISPVDGIVALKSVNAGEVVVMGQPLFSVINTLEIWVNARIEETYVGKLKFGQVVDFTIDGYPGQTFLGEIIEIGNAATSVFALIPTENASNNFTKVTQRIPIKISLPHAENVVFRPGMSAKIKIHL
jgi:membrane fusion protein (multidrug efflux system)